MQRQSGEAHADVLKIGTGCPVFFLPSGRESQRIVAWRRHLCGSTTGAVANLTESDSDWAHCFFLQKNEKELKILNGTIKIDVQNVEMTFEAEHSLLTMLLETMKLVQMTSIRHVSEERRGNSTDRKPRESHASRVDLTAACD